MLEGFLYTSLTSRGEGGGSDTREQDHLKSFNGWKVLKKWKLGLQGVQKRKPECSGVQVVLLAVQWETFGTLYSP